MRTNIKIKNYINTNDKSKNINGCIDNENNKSHDKHGNKENGDNKIIIIIIIIIITTIMMETLITVTTQIMIISNGKRR